MKKTISILLTFMIIMTSFGAVFATEAKFSEKIVPIDIVLDEKGMEVTAIVKPEELQFLGLGYITENGVNLRSGPSTSYPSLGSLAKYDTIAVYSDMENDTSPFIFVYVRSGKNEGKEGWVHEDYIAITDPARVPSINH